MPVIRRGHRNRGGATEARRHGEVAWTADDVQALLPEWSTETCDDWLAENAERIRDAAIRGGWDALEALLLYPGHWDAARDPGPEYANRGTRGTA